MKAIAFAKFFALMSVLALIFSLPVGSFPVYASICQVLNVTPNYPNVANASQMIEIDVTVVLNCSPYYTYSYMTVKVDLMPSGITRVIAEQVFRAYPYLSSNTARIIVLTPSLIGAWNVDAVITVVDYTALGGIDSITRIPINIEIGSSAVTSTSLLPASTQVTSTTISAQSSTTTVTQMLVVSASNATTTSTTALAPTYETSTLVAPILLAVVLSALIVWYRRSKKSQDKGLTVT